MNLPTLNYTVSEEAVAANKKLIDAARARVKAELDALAGLEKANQGLCMHPRKRDVYDPGYAGGGHDGYLCPVCGKRGYF